MTAPSEPVSTPEGLSLEEMAEGRRLAERVAAGETMTNGDLFEQHWHWLVRHAPDLLAAAEAVPGLEAEVLARESEIHELLAKVYTLLMDEEADNQERGEAAAALTHAYEDGFTISDVPGLEAENARLREALNNMANMAFLWSDEGTYKQRLEKVGNIAIATLHVDPQEPT